MLMFFSLFLFRRKNIFMWWTELSNFGHQKWTKSSNIINIQFKFTVIVNLKSKHFIAWACSILSTCIAHLLEALHYFVDGTEIKNYELQTQDTEWGWMNSNLHHLNHLVQNLYVSIFFPPILKKHEQESTSFEWKAIWEARKISYWPINSPAS